MKPRYDIKHLLQLHEEGILKMNKYKDQLYVFCYSPKCQYERLWDDITIDMRGIVVDTEGRVIAPCMPKFFNLNEVPETRPENLPKDIPYIIQNKADGSLIHTFFNPFEGRWQHTSKCSFDNEYIDAANRLLPPERLAKSQLRKDATLASEIRFDGDPMRRVTKMQEGMYLITAWVNSESGVAEMPFDGLDSLPPHLGIGSVGKIDTTLESALETYSDLEDTEGYVIRYSNNFRFKLKTPWYLTLNKAIEDFSTPEEARNTVKACLKRCGMSTEWIKFLPDELWDEAEVLANDVFTSYKKLDREIDDLYNLHYSDNRKEFALKVKDLPVASILFNKYSGKDYKELIWEKC